MFKLYFLLPRLKEFALDNHDYRLIFFQDVAAIIYQTGLFFAFLSKTRANWSLTRKNEAVKPRPLLIATKKLTKKTFCACLFVYGGLYNNLAWFLPQFIQLVYKATLSFTIRIQIVSGSNLKQKFSLLSNFLVGSYNIWI